MSDWLDETTHEVLITPEAKTALQKYETMEDAIAGGLKAQELVGRPYKLPESLDKLPDDTVRNEFRTSALKVLGIEPAANVEALKDFDFYVGKPEGYEPTEADGVVATAFAQHIVDTKMPVGIAAKTVEFYNTMMAKATEKAQADADKKFIADAEATNKKLEETMGGKDNVIKNTELIKRMFKNDAGLTTEQYENIADALIEMKFVHSDVMITALSNLAQKVTGEGTTEGGGGGVPEPKKKTEAEQTAKDLPKTAEALGWKK